MVIAWASLGSEHMQVIKQMWQGFRNSLLPPNTADTDMRTHKTDFLNVFLRKGAFYVTAGDSCVIFSVFLQLMCGAVKTQLYNIKY